MLLLRNIAYLFQMFACLSVLSVPPDVEREGLNLPCPCFNHH